MKKINRLLVGFVMLCFMSSEVFALNGGSGYVWISTGGNRAFDSAENLVSEIDYVLKADLNKGLPEINSVIRIEAKNKIYHDIGFIEYISKEFISLMKENKCESTNDSFTGFMTNYDNECSVNNVEKKVKKDYVYNDIFTFNPELILPVKAKVLGYVSVEQGVFVFVQIIEVIKEKK